MIITVLLLVWGRVSSSASAEVSTTDGEEEAQTTTRIIIQLKSKPSPHDICTGDPEADAILQCAGGSAKSGRIRPVWEPNKNGPNERKDQDHKAKYGLDRFFTVDISSDIDMSETVIEALKECHSVESAEIDRLGRGGGILVPSDTRFGSQWHLENTGRNSGKPDADIDASEGWTFTTGSESVLLAVLDTGIDSTHPEFAGRLVQGYDFVNDDNNPEDDHYHGTLCAGIAAANGDNNFGVAGVDWNVKIMPVKVLDQNNEGWVSELAQGITWAVDNGADVISMSLIDYRCNSNVLRRALKAAREAGAILISSAGNGDVGDADKSGPGCYSETISVGATDRNDARASLSGTGAALDVVAPGDLVPTVRYRNYGDGYSIFSGTSASCPIVAGIATLMVSIKPGITHEEVRTALIETAEDEVGPGRFDKPGRDDYYGHGRVNMAAALAYVFDSPAPTFQPTTSIPSLSPTSIAPTSSAPTSEPTTGEPSSVPTNRPTGLPTLLPTFHPTWSPKPSERPTIRPTMSHTSSPTLRPTSGPTLQPPVSNSQPFWRSLLSKLAGLFGFF